MGYTLGKKLFLAAAILLFACSAFAQSSDITIEVQPDNSLAANYVYDDDGTIGLVDIFDFYPDSNYLRYNFENVFQGQVFGGVSYDPTHTMYFNFTDFDGPTTGLGYMRSFEFAPPPQLCPNGTIDPGEDCEIDSDCTTPGWECDNSCVCQPPPPCPNGVIDPGEDCELDSDCAEFWACDNSCQCYYPDYCGNGVVDPGVGEDCEIDADCGGNGTCDNSCNCNFPPTALIVINGFELVPTIAETNDSYYVRVIVDVNDDHLIQSGELSYRFSESVPYSTAAMVKEGNDWVAAIGPYNGQISLYGEINIYDASSSYSAQFSDKWFNLMVPLAQACPSVYPIIELDGEPPGDLIMFAPLGDAFLEVSRNVDTGELFASNIDDDDLDIQLLSIHVVVDGVDTQYDYTDVVQGDTFITLPGVYDDAFYNFSDFDGTRVNMMYLLPFADYFPPPPCGNGVIEPGLGEECESNSDCAPGWECDNSCQCYALPPCGNGIPDPGEDCEIDSDCAPGWECDNSCACQPPPPCGNGIIEPLLGEDCELDSDCAPGWECDNSCVCQPPPPCGNGVVEPLLGEECELDGDCSTDQFCGGDCLCYSCGNGILEPGLGEECESDSDCDAWDECNTSTCACVASGDLPRLLANATINSRVSGDGEEFYLDIEARKTSAIESIDVVEFNYSIGNGAMNNTISLVQDGNNYVGTIGPYNAGNSRYLYSEVEARDFVLSRDEWNYDSLTNLGVRWHYLVPVKLAECLEICWDGIDNDSDGLIDEDCIELPELYFRQVEVPNFVIVDDRIEISAIVKNAGIVNAGPFQVSLYFDGLLIDMRSVAGLAVNGQATLNFSVDSNNWFGIHDLNLMVDSGNDVPEMNEVNNTHSQQLNIGYDSFEAILNYNDTYLLGDVRQAKFSGREGKHESNVNVEITAPNGQKTMLITGDAGIIEFQLTSSGDYVVNASKDRFESFFGSFGIAPMDIDFAPSINLGEVLEIWVLTNDGLPIPDAVIEIILPNGERIVLDVDDRGYAEYRTVSSGVHKIIISRKGVIVLEKTFESAGFVEVTYSFVGGGLEAIVGETILESPIQLLIFIAMCLVAAFVAYDKARRLFAIGPKGTRQKQKETAIRIAAAIMFFILPLQINKFLGFGGGVAFVLIEIVAAFFFDYYMKGLARRRKAIRVEKPKGFRL